MNKYVPETVAGYLPDSILLLYGLAGLLIVVYSILIIEPFIFAFSRNPTYTVQLSLSPLVILLPVFASTYLGLESYKNKFVAFHLFHSCVFNV